MYLVVSGVATLRLMWNSYLFPVFFEHKKYHILICKWPSHHTIKAIILVHQSMKGAIYYKILLFLEKFGKFPVLSKFSLCCYLKFPVFSPVWKK